MAQQGQPDSPEAEEAADEVLHGQLEAEECSAAAAFAEPYTEQDYW